MPTAESAKLIHDVVKLSELILHSMIIITIQTNHFLVLPVNAGTDNTSIINCQSVQAAYLLTMIHTMCSTTPMI